MTKKEMKEMILALIRWADDEGDGVWIPERYFQENSKEDFGFDLVHSEEESARHYYIINRKPKLRLIK